MGFGRDCVEMGHGVVGWVYFCFGRVVRTDRWWGVFCKVRGIRGHKGVGRGWVEM